MAFLGGHGERRFDVGVAGALLYRGLVRDTGRQLQVRHGDIDAAFARAGRGKSRDVHSVLMTSSGAGVKCANIRCVRMITRAA